MTTRKSLQIQEKQMTKKSTENVFHNYVEDHNRRDNASDIYNLPSCIQMIHILETIFSESYKSSSSTYSYQI